MEQWFVANLGDAMLAGETLDRVREQFEQRNEATPGAAVLMRHESDGRLHCELKLYFPPALAGLAERVGAQPCGEPIRSGLGVLIGAAECLESLGGASGA